MMTERDYKDPWFAAPAGRLFYGKDRWVVTNKDDAVMGFRHFTRREAHFIAYMENHYPDLPEYKDWSDMYMARLRSG